jgi:hypothetical protein
MNFDYYQSPRSFRTKWSVDSCLIFHRESVWQHGVSCLPAKISLKIRHANNKLNKTKQKKTEQTNKHRTNKQTNRQTNKQAYPNFSLPLLVGRNALLILDEELELACKVVQGHGQRDAFAG